MRQLSSKSTFFAKRVFPVIWLGFLAIFCLTSIFRGAVGEDPMFVAVPVFMAFAGLLFFRALLWKLADSVGDHGDYLVVRRGGVEAKVQLADVMNVSASSFSNPKTVSLRPIRPSALGQEIAFIPSTPFTLNPFAKVAVAKELTERAFSARG